MSNARELAELGGSYGTGGFVGMKNRIINGRFDVWQRSVGPVTGSGYATADRWNFPSSMTTQQVANDRDTSIPFALQVTADGTGYGQVVQRIEDVRSLSGGPATLSFWAKSPSAGAFRCEIGQIFGSGGSTAVYPLSNATQFNMAAANTWQLFTVTVDMPSVAGKTIGAGSYVQVQFGANSGIANRVMTYSEVQFEKGSTATSFDYRPYGTELALCQRYYNKVSPDDGNGGYAAYGTGYAGLTTTAVIAVSFPVAMRSAPTAVVSGTNRIIPDGATNPTLTGTSYLGTKGGYINVATTGLTVNRPALLTANNDTSAFVSYSAEL